MGTAKTIALIKALGGGSGGSNGGSGGGLFVVTVTDESGMLDKTYNEIYEAAQNRVVVLLTDLNGITIMNYLIGIGNGNVLFSDATSATPFMFAASTDDEYPTATSNMNGGGVSDNPPK